MSAAHDQATPTIGGCIRSILSSLDDLVRSSEHSNRDISTMLGVLGSIQYSLRDERDSHMTVTLEDRIRRAHLLFHCEELIMGSSPWDVVQHFADKMKIDVRDEADVFFGLQFERLYLQNIVAAYRGREWPDLDHAPDDFDLPSEVTDTAGRQAMRLLTKKQE